MIQVSDSNYLSVVDKGVVVLDFMADWCKPCKTVGEILSQAENKYKKVLFGKVNVDTSPALANKYNVSSIPTVVFLLDGVPAITLHGTRCTIYNIQKILDTMQ